MVRSSFLNMEITFAIFKVVSKVPDQNDKLAINDNSVQFETIFEIY